MKLFLRVLVTLTSGVVLVFGVGCSSPKPLTPAQRGRVIYRQSCISCHNQNPNLPGGIGPAIAGSSRQLVEARLLHDTYPPGYQPRRHTHTMRAMPWLAPHIDELTAYLAAAVHPATPPSSAAKESASH
ncbi:MAG: c-type cytochrome [Candidatus Binataceae bacterium]